MEEEGGRPLLGSSALRAERTAAGAPAPHRYPPLSNSPLKPRYPAFGALGVKAGHSGPPRPGGPGRVCRGSSGFAEGCQQPHSRPPGERRLGRCCPVRCGGPAGTPRVPGRAWVERGTLTPGGPDLCGGPQERSARLTVDARKIKIRGEGA